MSSTRAFALLEHCLPWLGVVALIAVALWAGILFSVSWLSGRARWMADGSEIGAIAMALNRRWAMPCLVVGVASALVWASTMPTFRFSVPGLALLGLLTVGLLFVHSIVSIRASRVARGSIAAASGEGMRRLFLVIALAAVTVVVSLRMGR